MYQLKSIQKIPASSETVWRFFSNPANLRTITPPDMDFVVLTQFDKEMIYPGQMIEYKVRPLFGIQLYWKTEIMTVEEPGYFIDEQRKGPFAVWRHQHFFKSIEGGVEMTDLLDYKIPFGAAGKLFARIVHKKVQYIFDFRRAAIEKALGKWPPERL